MANASSILLVVGKQRASALNAERSLKGEGYKLALARAIEEAREAIAHKSPELIILDSSLPWGRAIDLLREFNALASSPAIIVLGSVGKNEAEQFFREGADDYVAGPWSVPELMARVALRLRDRACRLQHLQLDGITIDLARQVVSRGGKRVSLTKRETRLLRALMAHANRAVTRAELLRAAWGYRVTPKTRTLDNCVAVLRKKIEVAPKTPKHLITIRGVGYRLSI